MADISSVPTKRKLDQLEDETQSSSPKKIKDEKNDYKEDIILFSDLHREIIHYILSFITNDTQRRHIRSVCQQWCDYINYNEFKIGLLLKSEVDEFSRCFGRYQKPIGLKFMKLAYLYNARYKRNQTLIRSNHTFESMLSSLTQLTALDLQLTSFNVPQELVNLQSLTVISPLNEDTLSRLTNLRRLNYNSSGDLPQIPTLTTLESLTLCARSVSEAYTRLTELRMSNSYSCSVPDTLLSLRKLSIFESGMPGYFSKLNLMKFSNLEELITNDSALLATGYPSSLTKLHTVSGEEVEIKKDLTQLKDLHCNRVKVRDNLVLNFIEDCIVNFYDSDHAILHIAPQKVTRLKARVVPQNYHIWATFTNLIDLDIRLDSELALDFALPSLTSLRQLKLCYSKYPHQWITQLTNLADLKLESVQELNSISPISFEMMHHLTSLQLFGKCDSINIINLTNLLQLAVDNAVSKSSAIEIIGLSTATNLTSLVVNNFELRGSLSIAPSAELALLTNLRTLSFVRTVGADFNIRDLTTLKHLTLLVGPVVNDSALYLTRLTQLQWISLQTDKPVDENAILKELLLCYNFEVTTTTRPFTSFLNFK